jgi:hypothetical protein
MPGVANAFTYTSGEDKLDDATIIFKVKYRLCLHETFPSVVLQYSLKLQTSLLVCIFYFQNCVVKFHCFTVHISLTVC